MKKPILFADSSDIYRPSEYNFAAIVDICQSNTLHDMRAYYQDYIDVSTHARPIAGAFLSLPWTFRLLNLGLLIFINFINILLPVDYGYLHNIIYIVN